MASLFSGSSDWVTLIGTWGKGLETGMVSTLLCCLLPAWFLGTLTGLMLPKPKWMSASPLVTVFAEFGGFKRLAVALHGFLILRECWYLVFEAGTFRLFLKAVGQWMMGKGWTFDFPYTWDPSPEADAKPPASTGWHITGDDLDMFKRSIQAPKWELMMEKDIPNLIVYRAWRRTLPSGKTEYKSTSVCHDATAEEFMDFYLDDDARPTWDSLIAEHEPIEKGNFANREMVVRWVRRFPFSFLSDREYVIARRIFREGATLYGISKAAEHPGAKRSPKVVKMDVFHSMWRSCTVACPWGSSKPACETTLLHLEQFKIPENLARFAARHGMWSFVHNMAKHVTPFVVERRKRCGPCEIDARAYGHPIAADGFCEIDSAPSSKQVVGSRQVQSSEADPAPVRVDSAASLAAVDNLAGEHGEMESPSLQRKSTLRGMATFAAVGAVAMVLRRSQSSASLSKCRMGPVRRLPSSQSQGEVEYTAKERFPNNRYRQSVFKS